ncbi:hypothetical protein [Paenibacillus sp. PAMC 26794]|uniref:hypothetical protein n=1 Tax=Paenibacillus sp. PAMC 26794 TaxID=1257080 RepID=UPI001266ED81|nr:hypothetical protein [Paenibacillus sp. PAMC 26794]
MRLCRIAKWISKMAGIPIKRRLARFYRHLEDGDEVFAIAECRDGYVYYNPIDGRGELEKMLSQQFFMEYEWIQD